MQIDHCKNPVCANFGVPPKVKHVNERGGSRKGTVQATPAPGDYVVTATGGEMLLTQQDADGQQVLGFVESPY